MGVWSGGLTRERCSVHHNHFGTVTVHGEVGCLGVKMHWFFCALQGQVRHAAMGMVAAWSERWPVWFAVCTAQFGMWLYGLLCLAPPLLDVRAVCLPGMLVGMQMHQSV